MSFHLQTEIGKLKKKILALSAVVEDDVGRAIRSILERDTKLAMRVIDMDEEIDRTEVDVEEECLKILALHQPVAIDLRYIVVVLKINNDLERIGDLAVKIAERAMFLNNQPLFEVPFDLRGMAEKVQWMLHRSLDALVNLDLEVARTVCVTDAEVDAIHSGVYDLVLEEIRRKPEHLESLLRLLSVPRCLERIADHATNIAEDVIYMINGEIVRHNKAFYQEASEKASA